MGYEFVSWLDLIAPNMLFFIYVLYNYIMITMFVFCFTSFVHYSFVYIYINMIFLYRNEIWNSVDMFIYVFLKDTFAIQGTCIDGHPEICAASETYTCLGSFCCQV